MIPQRFQPILFAAILSGLMSFIVAGIATLRSVGMDPALITLWTQNWLFSWAVACPTAYVIAPFARRLSLRMTAGPE
ncbi:DUF2798 domain-containing protein [Actibacterium sp. 188UL27-1]|uniref:DUF2798 domain-containing protein n=1 Tax=Actibacterium sp. 188UL27-1 TaxID=2786961 RepID=UPI00195E9D2B|nr:DUF2798 domain-containing protein [Actibacterium sp. 188UL27-1]MBM7066261.1 DUF2798 domain-containing protein [Actibacterium sp. 188UL27-1]